MSDTLAPVRGRREVTVHVTRADQQANPYYYIPFERGVESVKGDPITQFGGIYLTANVGFLR